MSLPNNFAERIAELEESEFKQVTRLRERAAIVCVERETAIEELFRVQQFILKKNQQLDKIEEETVEVQQRYKTKIGQVRTLEQRELARRFVMLRRGRGIGNTTRDESTPGSTPPPPSRLHVILHLSVASWANLGKLTHIMSMDANHFSPCQTMNGSRCFSSNIGALDLSSRVQSPTTS
jgi:hypothetical protein